MGYSVDWWGHKGQGEWGAPTHFLQGEDRQSFNLDWKPERLYQQGKLGATYWTPAGYCKAAEVNKQAAHIHTSHF